MNAMKGAARGPGALAASALAFTWAMGCIGAGMAAPASSALLTQVASSAAATRQAPQAVVGDLIVKFRGVAAPGPEHAARLAGELGVPLRFVQLTSGREALLAVDRPALAQSLMQRAQRERGVAQASVQPEPAAGLPPQHMVLLLRLRAGAQVEGLAERLRVAGVAPQLEPPGAQGNALMRLDLDAVTQALLAQMQQRSDIEYAQANRLLKPAR